MPSKLCSFTCYNILSCECFQIYKIQNLKSKNTDNHGNLDIIISIALSVLTSLNLIRLCRQEHKMLHFLNSQIIFSLSLKDILIDSSLSPAEYVGLLGIV